MEHPPSGTSWPSSSVGGFWARSVEVILSGDEVISHLREENACPRCDLTEARLMREDLHEADLIGARLIGAKLREADLTGANLDDASLSGAQLSGAIWIDATKCGERSVAAVGSDVSCAGRASVTLARQRLVGGGDCGVRVRGGDQI